MAQQKRTIKVKISKREQERIEKRKEEEKSNFSTIVMRGFIIVMLAAMIVGLAIQIIVYN